MYSRILNCDYEFVSPWWDEVSLNAKDLVSPSSPWACLWREVLTAVVLRSVS